MKRQQIITAALLTLAAAMAQAAEPLPGSAAGAKVGAATGSATAAAPAYKAKKLTRVEFDALLAQPEKLVVIDVRRPDELTKIGGFPVYLSIPVADLEKSLAYIPRERTIVTVSNHAGRSGKAADFLTSKGFKVAGTIGAQEYEEQGGTLTKILPPPPKPVASNP